MEEIPAPRSGLCQGMVHGRGGTSRNPQRPYARPAVGTCGKIWSDLCGDMQRLAEMAGPSGAPSNRQLSGRESGSNKLPKVAKSLVG